MSVYSVTGPTTATEGQNITLNITRQGDLSQAATLIASTVGWGNYSPSMQMNSSSDQTEFPRRYVSFAPGQALQTLSYQTFSDGEDEGWEYSFVRFDSIDFYGGDRFAYRNSDSINTNMGSQIWGTKVYDPGLEPTSYSVPTVQPVVTQTTPQATQVVNTPAPVAPTVVNNVSTFIDNSTRYTDNSVTNNYVNSFNTDNSVDNSVNTSISDSYNVDNSVNTYSLSSVTSSNDYSIGKTISGSGTLRGTADNDEIIGGKRNDRLYGGVGNDELIGGLGKDRLYGDFGSNVFNAGTSKSRRDADRLYIRREDNSITADIIESIGKSDRIYIQGSTGDLSVRGIDGGLGIFDNDVLQAIYTGNNFNASTLSNQLVAA